MGSLLGFLVGLGVISGAWQGDLEFWGLGLFVAAGIAGIVLIPMTVGTFMTSIIFMSPIALIAAGVRGNWNSAGIVLGIAFCAFTTQLIIGYIRQNSIQ